MALCVFEIPSSWDQFAALLLALGRFRLLWNRRRRLFLETSGSLTQFLQDLDPLRVLRLDRLEWRGVGRGGGADALSALRSPNLGSATVIENAGRRSEPTVART